MTRNNIGLLQVAVREVLLREMGPSIDDREPTDIDDDTAAEPVPGAATADATPEAAEGGNAAAYLDLIKGIDLGLTSKDVAMGASGNSGAWEVDPDDLVGLFDLLADPDSKTTAVVEDQLKLVQALAYAAPIIQLTLGDARTAQVAARIESEIQKIKAAVEQGKAKLDAAKKKADEKARARAQKKKGKTTAPAPEPVVIDDDPYNENEAFTIDKEPAGFEEQILMERIMSRLLRRKILSESRYSAAVDALAQLLKKATPELSTLVDNVRFKQIIGALYTAALEDDATIKAMNPRQAGELIDMFNKRFISAVKAGIDTMSNTIETKISSALDTIIDDFAKSLDKLDQASFAAERNEVGIGAALADAIEESIVDAGGQISQKTLDLIDKLAALKLSDGGEIVNTLSLISDSLAKDAIEVAEKSVGTAGDEAAQALGNASALHVGSSVVKRLSADISDTIVKVAADLAAPETFIKIRDSISTAGQRAARAAGAAGSAGIKSAKKVDWKDVLGAIWDPIGKAAPSTKVIWAPPGTGGFRKLLNAFFVLPVRASLWMLYAAVATGVINETGENAYDLFSWIKSDAGEKAIESMKNVFVVIELAPEAFTVLAEQFTAYEPQEGTVSGALAGLQALGGFSRSSWMEKIMTPVDVAKGAISGAAQGISSFSTGVDIENAAALKEMSTQAATLCTTAAGSYQKLREYVASGDYELAKNAVDVPVISAGFKKLWEDKAPAAFFGGPLGGG